jgi:putative endonuclease
LQAGGQGFESPQLHFAIMFYTYILQRETSNRYYIGSTEDVSRRVAEHNRGKSNSIKAYRPCKLVYCERFESLAKARQREQEIKSWESHEYTRNRLGLSTQLGKRPGYIGKVRGSNPLRSIKAFE